MTLSFGLTPHPGSLSGQSQAGTPFAFAPAQPQFFQRNVVPGYRHDVLRLILGRGARLAGIGAGCGLAAALALTHLMKGLLYGVSAIDPPTFASVIALLTFIALLASYIPARRATRVDPTVALRCE